MECGYISHGEMAGKWWEISQQEAGALYRLEIGNEFYASADSIRDLLDEVDALVGLARGETSPAPEVTRGESAVTNKKARKAGSLHASRACLVVISRP